MARQLQVKYAGCISAAGSVLAFKLAAGIRSNEWPLMAEATVFPLDPLDLSGVSILMPKSPQPEKAEQLVVRVLQWPK